MTATQPLAAIDAALVGLRALRTQLSEALSEALSETDTRCKVVDEILVGILGWQEQNIRREVVIENPQGYVDYVLSTTHPAFIVEAKRNGSSFKLPKGARHKLYLVGGVLSEDRELKAAMTQAR